MPDQSSPAGSAAEEIVRGDGGCAQCEFQALCASAKSKRVIKDCIAVNIATIIDHHFTPVLAEKDLRIAELEKYVRSVLPKENNAWWCPTCKVCVSGSEVTYEEYHEECGTYLSDCQPDIEKARDILKEATPCPKQ